MKLLKRNMTQFEYRAYLGKTEVLNSDNRHTGRSTPQYDDPVQYEGSISPARANAFHDMFGIDARYTHVLLTDDPTQEFGEAGLIDWNGDTYEIMKVSKSLNVTALALRKRVKNHAVTE